MNYQLMNETFPQLKPYQAETTNKYIFQGETGIWEVPKSQITEHERTILSIFLKQLPEDFNLQQLWQNYVEDTQMVEPEKITDFQLFKITFSKPMHKLFDFQCTFDAIAKQSSYMLKLTEESYCILFVNCTEFLQMEPYVSLLKDDFQINFQLMTTSVEPVNNLRNRIELMKTLPPFLGEHTSDKIERMDDMLVSKMLTSFDRQQSLEFCQAILQQAMGEPLLLETINIYIRNFFNFSQTAKALYIHRNTLQKRLERFEVLSQKDLKKSEDLFKIMLTLKLMTMYNLHTKNREI